MKINILQIILFLGVASCGKSSLEADNQLPKSKTTARSLTMVSATSNADGKTVTVTWSSSGSPGNYWTVTANGPGQSVKKTVSLPYVQFNTSSNSSYQFCVNEKTLSGMGVGDEQCVSITTNAQPINSPTSNCNFPVPDLIFNDQNITDNAVEFTWITPPGSNNPSDPFYQYKQPAWLYIRYRIAQSTDSWQHVTPDLYAPNSTSGYYRITGLEAGTNYEFQVAALCNLNDPPREGDFQKTFYCMTIVL